MTTSNKLTLAVDVDGTIADLMTPWVKRYNRDYKDNLTPYNILDWDVRKFTKPEAGDMTFEYLEDASLYDEVLPIEGSLDAVDTLREYYNIKYVTHATNGTKGRKFLWLKEHGFIKDGDEYFEMKDKSDFPADFLIDDKYENVVSFIGEGRGVGFLFGQPWNYNEWIDEEPEGLTVRFNDWSSMTEFLVSMYNIVCGWAVSAGTSLTG